ncbi:hypothetical protein N431DRAFT_440825 [Stipitochalara longipes BDJ]|nr:hypothetical protein N431DRAFT_440825 [Stipitochalara longipes BDJ]
MAEQGEHIVPGADSTIDTILSEASSIPPPTLITVPAELHLELFKHLDTCSSVCLGLTCKKLWAIHSEKGKVLLYNFTVRFRQFPHPVLPGRIVRRLVVYTCPLKVTDANGREFTLAELLKSCIGRNYWLAEDGKHFLPIWVRDRQIQSQLDRIAHLKRKEDNKKRIADEARKRKEQKIIAWKIRQLELDPVGMVESQVEVYKELMKLFNLSLMLRKEQ